MRAPPVVRRAAVPSAHGLSAREICQFDLWRPRGFARGRTPIGRDKNVERLPANVEPVAFPRPSSRRPRRPGVGGCWRSRSAENRDVVLADADRKFGSLLIGGQGSGKTSVALRAYRNDIRDPDAAVIVIDPKSELSRIALEHTPPDVGKRVWYLDLGRPAFGMTPLRVDRRSGVCLRGGG